MVYGWQWLCCVILPLGAEPSEHSTNKISGGVSVAKSNLLIVYHSQSGRNLRLAYAAARCAEAAGASVRLLRASEAGSRDVIWAEALLLVFPENFGQLPGALKDFLDRSFYPACARARKENKIVGHAGALGKNVGHPRMVRKNCRARWGS